MTFYKKTKMSDNLSNENVQREIETAIELENQLTISATEQQPRENLILKVQFLEEILKLRENKTKTKEANEEGEAASNESKKEKALRLLMKDEINEIIHVLRTQTGKEGKKHQKFYYFTIKVKSIKNFTIGKNSFQFLRQSLLN